MYSTIMYFQLRNGNTIHDKTVKLCFRFVCIKVYKKLLGIFYVTPAKRYAISSF